LDATALFGDDAADTDATAQEPPAAVPVRSAGGARARAAANLSALAVLRDLDGRAPTADERAVLSRWCGWGAVPLIFDERDGTWATERGRLRDLVGEDGYCAARGGVLNGHYTHPELAAALWDGVRALGFTGGRVLDPGCGAGAFIAAAPAGARMVGVELDPATAAVCAALHPAAEVVTGSFADAPLTSGSFDVAVGNVPFADVVVHDPACNAAGLTLHNYFIVKALMLMRPGGVCAFVTSSYTLDSAGRKARDAIHELADIVGAVRLPTGAHRKTAGTDALTDVLVLRRRVGGERPRGGSWLRTRTVDLDGRSLRVNAYFAEHPDRVLGTLTAGRGERGRTVVEVVSSGADTAVALREALSVIASEAIVDGVAMSGPPAATAAAGSGSRGDDATATRPDGAIVVRDDGTFAVTASDGTTSALTVAASRHVELAALLALRDHARRLLDIETADADDSPALTALRSAARTLYERYVARYGPINRFTLRHTGRLDPDTGEPGLARVVPPAIRLLRRDPDFPLVLALEIFDDATQDASPAGLLRHRVLAPAQLIEHVDDVMDAMAISLDRTGRVDAALIARLTGHDAARVRGLLGSAVYDDPDESGGLIAAAEYLTGNVRRKLRRAVAAAGRDERYTVNVRALRAALPPDLGVSDVEPRLGAAWIDAATHREFLREILDDDTVKVEHPCPGVWGVAARDWTVAATATWGTGRYPAPRLVLSLIEQRPVVVYDTHRDPATGKDVRVLNPDETAAAVEKGEGLQERFCAWCWEDPDRTARLLAEYNDRFNSLVMRDYTDAGDRLTFPGMALDFRPHRHQLGGVARILAEPAVGLFHEVGAGKTATMILSTHKLRQLGLAGKTAVVVPNHMLEQFTREWLHLFPAARVLAAGADDLTRDRRRAFVARVAANDWDAVILTRSAFERLGVDPHTEAQYIREELGRLREALQLAADADGRGLTVKRLQKLVASAEERLKSRLDMERDPAITFEQTGIRRLVCDEAHDYKNLTTMSRIPGAAITPGSKRATDLLLKLWVLRRMGVQRPVTFATATPIANSIAEAHVMMRFLAPDLLDAADLGPFDAWAATFGALVAQIEMAPACDRYRLHTRFARFLNVPELLAMWGTFADVKTAEDLDLPVPLIARRDDGQRLPEIVVVQPSDAVRGFIRGLGARADAIRDGKVKRDEDNMLAVCTDGRKAALSMALVDGDDEHGGKLTVAADRIAAIHHEHADRAYIGRDGQPSPLRGGLQLVFCDLGVPGSERWDAYRRLRDLLAERGVPVERVRSMQDARNDAEKARLFAAARAGHVSVLIGTTQMMGTGVNVQDRIVSLVHVDGPWRPADVTQRDGRGIRPGNQNAEVQVLRIVTGGSFDVYMWGCLERKARFIGQVVRSKVTARSIEDVSDSTLSFAEVKALASGDPLILDKARADAELARLRRLQRAHERAQWGLDHKAETCRDRATDARRDHRRLGDAVARCRPTRGERFEMTIGERTVTSRADAAHLLAAWMADRGGHGLSWGVYHANLGHAGRLGGLDVDVELVRDPREGVLAVARLRGLPIDAPWTTRAVMGGFDTASLIRKLENRIADLPQTASDRLAAAEAAEREATAAVAAREPFKYDSELAAAAAHVDEIDQLMQERALEEARRASEDAAAVAKAHKDAGATSPAAGAAPQPCPTAKPAGPRHAAGRDAVRLRSRPVRVRSEAPGVAGGG
jgi:N12 class adenine-specific DNA methylase